MSNGRPHYKDLPAVRHWASQHDAQSGLWDYLAQNGGASIALVCSYLFWPSFVETKGCVVLAERYDAQNFQEWWVRLSGNVSEVEGVVNHVHLWDLFYAEREGLPAGALEALASVMARTWECALAQEFPSRKFSVRVSKDGEDYGPTISFSSVP